MSLQRGKVQFYPSSRSISLILATALAGCAPRPPETTDEELRVRRTTRYTLDAGAGTVGTAHPFRVIDVAGERSVVLCQARENTDADPELRVSVGQHGEFGGDRMRPYLVFGHGEGRQIDALVSRDDAGTNILVIRNGALELHRSNQVVLLSRADVRDDADVALPHRAGSIAANGLRMAYIRRGSPHDLVVARDLTSGEEREIDAGPELWRVHTDPAGRWARISLVEGGRTVQQRLAEQHAHGFARHACVSRPFSSEEVRWEPHLHTLWVDLATGSIVDDPDVIAPVGERLLRHDGSDGLRLGTDVLADACEPKIVAYSEKRILVACKPRHGEPATLRLLGAGFDQTIAEPIIWRNGRERFPQRDRFCEEGRCIDLATGVVVSEGDDVELDLGELEAHGRAYGKDAHGRALVGAADHGRWRGLPVGPLRWFLPRDSWVLRR